MHSNGRINNVTVLIVDKECLLLKVVLVRHFFIDTTIIIL